MTVTKSYSYIIARIHLTQGIDFLQTKRYYIDLHVNRFI